jgi:thiosulfate/3-mercaptopyruvate sulfurtransferase
MSAGELAAALSGNPPVLLDVRWRLGGPPGIIAYREGHLPGAVFVDLGTGLAGQPRPGGHGGRHPLPEPEAFQETMRRAGVRDDGDVVVYDEDDALAAARAWWLLRYFGHRQVRVLDGGYRGWKSAGLPVVTGSPPASARGDFTAHGGHMPVLDATGAAGVARQGVLLDARAAERYRGEAEPVDPVAGHIPGAVSAPATGNVGPDGRFLPAAGLRARFAALGVTPGRPAGCYCGSGITAAQQVLALELAGLPAALYAGSWSDWVSVPERPVAVGSEPG